jgi:hypothetical protein
VTVGSEAVIQWLTHWLIIERLITSWERWFVVAGMVDLRKIVRKSVL